MRFSLLSMMVIMICILVAGVVTVKLYKSEEEEKGLDIVLIVLRDRDGGLDKRFLRNRGPLEKKTSSTSITFLRCIAPSSWYPAAAASLLTGLYPSEHGLTTGHAYLSRDVATLAERMQATGYQTLAVVDEMSLLRHTNVLQGFDGIIEESGWIAVEDALDFACDHPGSPSVFELIEIDSARFRSSAKVEKFVEKIVGFLERKKFFEKGILAICAPGGEPGEYLAVAGGPLAALPGKVMLKPSSLIDLNTVLRDLVRGEGFTMSDSDRCGRALVMETSRFPSGDSDDHENGPLGQMTRTVWFDDLAMHVRMKPDGTIEFLDENDNQIEPAVNDRHLAMTRLEKFAVELRPVRDVNIRTEAGPRLKPELAEELSGPWLRSEFEGRNLHAVEHFRIGEALLRDGRPVEAAEEFAAACTMDTEFPEALLLLARATAHADREKAVGHYREYIDRFGFDGGEEAGVKEAREFLAR